MDTFSGYLLISVAVLCLGLASAVVARAAARDARTVLRQLRSQVNEIELECTRHSAAIKRLTSSVGSLGRWSAQKAATDSQGLPDPSENPEKWRAAVRRLAVQPKRNNEELS